MLRKVLAMLPHEERYRSMWKNFAQSIGLLTIAMMAALYSSGAGRGGRVASAGISALLALGIAVWVGVRFVPRLARGVDWDWIPFLTQYQITRPGWMFFAAVATVLLSAINTNNNLLYMVLSAMLAVLVLSGFLSALNFRFVNFDLRLPETGFVGEALLFSLHLKNQKQVFPTFSLRVESSKDSVMRFKPFYFAVVHPGTQASQSAIATFGRRGSYAIEALRVSSRYPFGFFSRTRSYPVQASCICFPAIIPREQMDFASPDLRGSQMRFERGRGHDLHTIRDYVPSDSARQVHWKASAKTNSLKTREYAAEEGRRVVLAFDRFGKPGDSERFEEMVSYAASMVFHLTKEDMDITFVSDEWQSREGGPEVLLESILTYLAVVEMSPDAGAPDVDRSSRPLVVSIRDKRS